ncbi:MAG: hypothetical protein ACRDNL_23130, partial [Spirillospora sp.]
RTIALADRLHFVRSFHPTMSPAAARRTAQNADAPAYSEAVSEYADLSGAELRDAVRRCAHDLTDDADDEANAATEAPSG